jgi:hypothetical protein
MKAYQLMGIDTAMHLLRPGAKWEFTGGVGFTRWDDPRPCPTVEEVFETIEKIKAFEDSINTILLPEQQKAFEDHVAEIEKGLAA